VALAACRGVWAHEAARAVCWEPPSSGGRPTGPDPPPAPLCCHRPSARRRCAAARSALNAAAEPSPKKKTSQLKKSFVWVSFFFSSPPFSSSFLLLFIWHEITFQINPEGVMRNCCCFPTANCWAEIPFEPPRMRGLMLLSEAPTRYFPPQAFLFLRTPPGLAGGLFVGQWRRHSTPGFRSRAVLWQESSAAKFHRAGGEVGYSRTQK